jgi:hypothetical protein
MSFINTSIFKNMAIKDANKEIVVINTDNNNLSFHSSTSNDNVDTMSIGKILNKTSNMGLEICSFNNNVLTPVLKINNSNPNCVITQNLNMSSKKIINLADPDDEGDAVNLNWFNTFTPTDLGDLDDVDSLYATRAWTQENIPLTNRSYEDTGSDLGSGDSQNNRDVCLEIGKWQSISTADSNVYPFTKIHPPNSSSGPWFNYVQDSSTTSYLGWAWGSDVINEIDSNKNSLFYGNVGIGVANPTYKLDINGDINLTGSIRVNGTEQSFGGSSLWVKTGDDIAYGSAASGHLQMPLNKWLLWPPFNTANGIQYGLYGLDLWANNNLLRVTNEGALESSWGTFHTSDDRLKINEKLIQNSTNTLLKLRPQIYDKKKGLNSDETKKEAGLIVQEIYYEAPELRYLISIPDDATLIDDNKYRNFEDIRNDPDYSNWGASPAHLNYTGLIPYLIQGFKEQNNEITTLKTTVSNLENKNIELENKINDLYSIINELKTKI